MTTPARFAPVLAFGLALALVLALCGALPAWADTPAAPAAGAPAAAAPSAAAEGYHFPAEFEPHEAVWMGWPVYENKAGWSVKDLHVRLWAAMAPHVLVYVAVNPDDPARGLSYDGQLAEIKALMKQHGVPEERVRFFPVRHEDVWWRDMGPVYLVGDKGQRAIAEFGFNGWGYEPADSAYAKAEDAVAPIAARLTGVDKAFRTAMISEGGDREFNGKGVLIVVEAVERQRNPGMTREQMEAEFKRVLGVTKVIWLKQGRYDDDLSFKGRLPDEAGKHDLYTLITTGGHIDEHVRFVGPNRILYTEITEEEARHDPIAAENKRRADENLAILRAATDQDGKPFELIPMPDAPTIEVTLGPGDGAYDYLASNDRMKASNPIPAGQPIRGILASSYLNFLVTNGVVLAQKFWKEGRPEAWRQRDEQARKTLQQVFPDRRVIAFDASAINVGGGGIHCNTQQVPKAR